MADIFKEQERVKYAIGRVVENLKKKGVNDYNKGMVTVRRDHLDTLWLTFAKNHEQIESTATAAQRQSHDYFVQDWYNETKEAYLDEKGYLSNVLDEFTIERSKDTKTATPDATITQFRPAVQPMQIPTFDRDYTKWPSFRDLFTTLIVRNPAMMNLERLHHLKGCPAGYPGMLLRNMPLEATNLAAAWTALQDLYNNKGILVQHQLNDLDALPVMRKRSVDELKALRFKTWDAVSVLAVLGRPVDRSADWLVRQTVNRLDQQTRMEWQVSLGTSTQPASMDTLKDFLDARILAVEAASLQSGVEVRQQSRVPAKAAKVHQVSTKRRTGKACDLCQELHYIYSCLRYRQMTPDTRLSTVKRLQLCLNCLGKHRLDECPSDNRCRRCSTKHDSSLHDACSPNEGATVLHALQHRSDTPTAVLSTARVGLFTPIGTSIVTRALVDPGSEVSLISETLAQSLGLKRMHSRVSLMGVGGTRSQVSRGQVSVPLALVRDDGPILKVTALILPEISRYLPPQLPGPAAWPHLEGITLANPHYAARDFVDVLLGADVYNRLLLDGVRRGSSDQPVAQESRMGWILTGGLSRSSGQTTSAKALPGVHCCIMDRGLDDLLQQFWQQEEVQVVVPPTPDDEACEQHFKSTYRRMPERRFMVRLPFHPELHLGTSRPAALRALESIQRRFRNDEDFERAYRAFMQDYVSLGHMEVARRAPIGSRFYLPHHGVLKATSTTTKLRVVFNGSRPTSSEKMYRQILVHEDDWDHQRILWRAENQGKVTVYTLSTVTYGLACAPYLALRCLHQLASDEESRFPFGAAVLRSEVYIDDVLSGRATVEEAKRKRGQLNSLLRAGGFVLRKWASNTPKLLEDSQEAESIVSLHWDSESTHSVLGLRWLANSDEFQVHVTQQAADHLCTKRTTLSQAAQIFDPLGWLAPVTVWAKIFIQGLCLLKTDWDAALPPQEEGRWYKFFWELPALDTIRVPRWLGLSPDQHRVELHGFADASERAYAAVVYLRTTCKRRDVRISLIAAKTKVAPLKRTTIPRLELCASHLLSRLTAHVSTTLAIDAELHCWTDSRVVLGWIQGHPSRWPTFVANRVADIQGRLPHAVWRHVKGEDNPADCASRGILPSELPDHNLWWQGPNWLAVTTAWAPETIDVHEEEEGGVILCISSGQVATTR
ncbi:PREDICTED: uncharacterized protein LOC107193038 [Dufourea novaeangliae]|uniref:uncharacterized protein LOC107193038 n=1 Tax=Dufourea novaeangliae TaxID=178035 RepID=UPI00076765F8|nr:PREDICTED: uncharacterized protein LOC107193038 [Dufourea novaeangliae]